jgi:hypothetical protein
VNDNVHGRYLVSGKTAYRDNPPGTVFEAVLDPGPEMRAIARGSITLLERVIPSVQPGSYVLPQGWLTPRDADRASNS